MPALRSFCLEQRRTDPRQASVLARAHADVPFCAVQRYGSVSVPCAPLYAIPAESRVR